MERVLNALNRRIDYLLGMAESANEIYADRGAGAVSMGYTPDNFDFCNEATGYIRRAHRLMDRRDRIAGIVPPAPAVEEIEDLPF